MANTFRSNAAHDSFFSDNFTDNTIYGGDEGGTGGGMDFIAGDGGNDTRPFADPAIYSQLLVP